MLEVILTYDHKDIRDECIQALQSTKTDFREMQPDMLKILSGKASEVVVWGISEHNPQTLALVSQFLDHHKSSTVIIATRNEIINEFEKTAPEEVNFFVTLPADPLFFSEVLQHAATLSATESEIRNIRDKIRYLETEFDVFLRVGRAIASSLELNQVLTSIMNITGRLLESEAWSLGLIDHDSGEIVFEAALGQHGQQIKGMRIPKGKGVIGWVAEHGEPLIVADTSKDIRHLKEVDRSSGFQSRSILCLPLKAREKVVGVIEFINKIGKGIFTTEDIDKVRIFADLAAVSIENALLYRRVTRLSETDELSGLYNQRMLLKLLSKELDQSKRNQTPLGYIFLDLDKFKTVNDCHGHLMGRETLREVGDLLKSVVANDAILGRFGGDEFCVILPGYNRERSLETAEKIRRVFEDHVFLVQFGLTIKLTASIGLALVPDHTSSFDELTRIADQAMSAAKRKARNLVVCADQNQLR